jgi:transposase
MMGKRSGQEDLFSYNINLDKRVPANHPLRQIKQQIDFSFARSAVASTYGINGHVSEDPEVILKLMFLLFFDNLPSERELMHQVAYRLDYLWFLGLTLDDQVPDHSILSKARRRWGRDVFEELFVRTVRQCVEAGLVDGKKLHFDGSLIDANASKDSVVSGPPELIAALRSAYRETARRLDDDDESVGGGPGGAGGRGCGGDEFKEGGRKPGCERKMTSLLSATDPDAAVVGRRGLSSRPRYKTHRAVDDREGVITAVATTPGDVEENRLLVNLMEGSESNTGIVVETAVADAQYGTAENFRELKRRGVRTHMADLGLKNTRETGLFSDELFGYDPRSDTYTCPAGQLLKKRHFKPHRQAYYYGCSARICNGCSRREECTRSRHGRTVMRHVDHELVEAGRRESASAAAKRDRARRKFLAEGSFADGSNNHGLKRSRWRGLAFLRIQDLLIAACQNVKKLILHQPPLCSKTAVMEKSRLQKDPWGSDLSLLRRVSDLFRRLFNKDDGILGKNCELEAIPLFGQGA